MKGPFVLAVAVLCAHLVWGASAHAASTEADVLFRDGRDLLEKGRWSEACDKLQRSEKLAPAVGTLLNLGFCWEQLGRMRSAMDAYAEAEILAGDAGDAKSATFARERFTAVEAKVMKLVIRVERENTHSLQLTRNGRPFPKTDWGKPFPVDPEDVVITASAPGYVPWRSIVIAKGEATQLTVVVPPLEKVEASSIRGLGTRRIAALGIGAASLAAFGAGTALAFSAKSRHDDAKALCDPSGCDATGSMIKSSAVAQGNVATVFFIAGVACVGTAVYLWLTGATEQTFAVGWRKAPPGTVVW